MAAGRGGGGSETQHHKNRSGAVFATGADPGTYFRGMGPRSFPAGRGGAAEGPDDGGLHLGGNVHLEGPFWHPGRLLPLPHALDEPAEFGVGEPLPEPERLGVARRLLEKRFQEVGRLVGSRGSPRPAVR